MAARIVIPSHELRSMADRLLEVAIEYIELAYEVDDMIGRYSSAFPLSDRDWVEADLNGIRSRVEDLAFYWEPDIAALLMAAKMAEQEAALNTGWKVSLGLIDAAYGLISTTSKRAELLGISKAAAIRSVKQKALIEFARRYADELPVKALGRLAGLLSFALDTYLYWEESRQFDQALAKAAIPAGAGIGGGALATRVCGSFTKHPLALGGCFLAGSLVGGVVGQFGVDYYERRFESDN